MNEHRQIQQQYAFALDALRMLAQRELLSWWDQTAHLTYVDQRRLLAQPFLEIVRKYGEQAAYSAADYLFLSRSLDESLAKLEYPEIADPVGFEQAQASYRYAMWLKEYSEDPEARQVAKAKLMGVVQRLVTEPARTTVEMGVVKAGTAYARVPEPGACAFCLMLASRGAVYSKQTVLTAHAHRENRKHSVGIKAMKRYHDNCRCLGIEVKRDGSDLPKINRELEKAWGQAMRAGSEGTDFQKWATYIEDRRLAAMEAVKFPEIPGLKMPKYQGDATRVVDGKREPLPALDKLAGHILYGWRSDRSPEKPLVLDKRSGHTSQSVRVGKTRFPMSWSDQQILDACVKVLQTGLVSVKGNVRVVDGVVDGVKIRMKYTIFEGKAVHVYGYPLKSPGRGTSVVKRGGGIAWH
ncbi:hypothetical protein HW450_12855 [Corynebacterium hindlerae]|uniref:Bacterial EndoU nuclease domain-containing protein n=1 Tax=Corynebacterium hindlerae TaxID=699041 RepID=A0A7G5FEZ4_9CORY|nr:hypothetical protein [Corynebacterium hindlerae]QMV85185.1 hypothetical protein HW450_12855 [Corynebacterium hindlerae]